MQSSQLGLVLDSSVVITAERKKQPVANFIEDVFRTYGPTNLSLSPVTVAELVHGIYRSKNLVISERRRKYIEELIRLVPVHPITTQAAWLAGQIEGEQAAKGNIVPFSDLLIAITAIEQDYGVLTNNLRHFQKIPGLVVLSLPA